MTHCPARLTLLGSTPRELAVIVKESSGAGVRLCAAERVPVSALVRLEWGDAMFLGECVHSSPARDGSSGYVAGIRFEQVLDGLQELHTLAARLMSVGGGETALRDSRAARSPQEVAIP